MNNYTATTKSELPPIVRDTEINQKKPDAGSLFAEIKSYLQRFVAYPDENCLIAHLFWIAHAHLMEAWESTPRLAFLSPEPGSGKTRALEVTENLVPNPVEAVNVTPAYLFRKVGDADKSPTILFDEIDTVFGPKAKDNEEIRGLLNAGHRRGAVAGRCVVKGKEVTTEEIPAYSAVALAGIGNLPDTILTRSVVIRMRRRAPHERVEPYRRRIHADEGHFLRDRIADWALKVADGLSSAYPEMPEGIEDRNADVWEPLIAIADVVGGEWPSKVRLAAVSLVSQSQESTPSLGIKLLEDLRTVFAGRAALWTTEILNELNSLDEAPWGNLRGQELDARALAKFIKPYGVKSCSVRAYAGVQKGYKYTDLSDAWSRYCAPLPTSGSVTSDTKVTSAANVTNVTAVTHLSDQRGSCLKCAGEGCRYCDVP